MDMTNIQRLRASPAPMRDNSLDARDFMNIAGEMALICADMARSPKLDGRTRIAAASVAGVLALQAIRTQGEMDAALDRDRRRANHAFEESSGTPFQPLEYQEAQLTLRRQSSRLGIAVIDE